MSDYQRPDKIYFFATTDRSMIKIGIASDPVGRMERLRGGSPLQIEMHAIADGSYAVEKKVHHFFWAHHSHCEWFFSHPDIWAAIDSIKATGKLPEPFYPRDGEKFPRFKWGPGSRRQTSQRENIGHAGHA